MITNFADGHLGYVLGRDAIDVKWREFGKRFGKTKVTISVNFVYAINWSKVRSSD